LDSSVRAPEIRPFPNYQFFYAMSSIIGTNWDEWLEPNGCHSTKFNSDVRYSPTLSHILDTMPFSIFFRLAIFVSSLISSVFGVFGRQLMASFLIGTGSATFLWANPDDNIQLDFQVMKLAVQEADRIESLSRSPQGSEEILRKRLVWGSVSKPLWQTSSVGTAGVRTVAEGPKKTVRAFPKGVNKRTFEGGEVESGYDVEWEVRPRENSDSCTLLLAVRSMSVHPGPVFDQVEVTTEIAVRPGETLQVFRQDIQGKSLVGYAKISKPAAQGTSYADPDAHNLTRFSLQATAFRVSSLPPDIVADPAKLAEWTQANGKFMISSRLATQSGRMAAGKVGEEEYFEFDRNSYYKSLTSGTVLKSILMQSPDNSTVTLGGTEAKVSLSGTGVSRKDKDFFNEHLLEAQAPEVPMGIGTDYAVVANGVARNACHSGTGPTDDVPPVVVVFRVEMW
jgi:hypothetical protein